MKIIVALTMLMIVFSPHSAMASSTHRPVGKVLDTIPTRNRTDQRSVTGGNHARHLPRRSTVSVRPQRSTHPRKSHPSRSRHRRPFMTWPAQTTTVVREFQPIVIVAPPVHQEPPPTPKPQKIWIPPVMGTRTEPGYWDYGIRKVWMGDHWRFEQDNDQREWVPDRQVEVVKQEGYWKSVE